MNWCGKDFRKGALLFILRRGSVCCSLLKDQREKQGFKSCCVEGCNCLCLILYITASFGFPLNELSESPECSFSLRLRDLTVTHICKHSTSCSRLQPSPVTYATKHKPPCAARLKQIPNNTKKNIFNATLIWLMICIDTKETVCLWQHIISNQDTVQKTLFICRDFVIVFPASCLTRC